MNLPSKGPSRKGNPLQKDIDLSLDMIFISLSSVFLTFVLLYSINDFSFYGHFVRHPDLRKVRGERGKGTGEKKGER